MDLFQVDQSYLTIVDRHSNWLSIFRLAKDDSTQIKNVLKEYFVKWGVAKEFISTRVKILTSPTMANFFVEWGNNY